MGQKLRIVFLEEWPSLRGTKILPYLAEKFDITYVTSSRGVQPNANFKDIHMFPPPKFINQHGFAFSRLADRLYREGHVDFAVSYAGIAFLTRQVPIINFMGGSYYTDFLLKWQSGSLIKKLRLPIGFLHYTVPEYIACKRANAHIVNSEGLKKDLMQNYSLSRENIQVVHNGVDEDFRSLGQKKSQLRPAKAIFIGRLHASKGILEFVNVFHQRQDIEIELIIAGDGPDYNKIETISQNDSRIIMLGHVPKSELLQHMEKTNIFVFPTSHEGCPNSLLEAIASHHACIVYDIPPVIEVLQNAGIIVELNQADEMCSQLKKLMSAPSAIDSLANEAFVQAKSFSWDGCARSVEKVFLKFGATAHNR